MILGLRTAIYPTPDLSRGKEWYRQVLGHDPYFDEPFYVGFSAGGFELGLLPDGEPGVAGVQVFWAVSDAAAELARLAALGAEVHEFTQLAGVTSMANFQRSSKKIGRDYDANRCVYRGRHRLDISDSLLRRLGGHENLAGCSSGFGKLDPQGKNGG